jgi:hypothetical protein
LRLVRGVGGRRGCGRLGIEARGKREEEEEKREVRGGQGIVYRRCGGVVDIPAWLYRACIYL